MKKFLQNLFENHLNGGYSIKVGSKYVSFPKLAPLMILAMLTTGIGVATSTPIVGGIGAFMIIIGIIAFFYYELFPSRLPNKKDQ